MKDVADWKESSLVDHRPDLGLYPIHDKAEEAFVLNTKDTRIHVSRRLHRARVAWAWLRCVGELKHDPARSGFLFGDGDEFLHDTDEGKEARAQHIKSAAELMYRQHRTHVFTFYVLKSRARLLRWDRAGLIISEPIDLLQKPGDFLNFFYRLAAMTPEELGYDTTATLASEDQVRLLQEHKPKNIHAKSMLSFALSKTDQYPIYAVRLTT